MKLTLAGISRRRFLLGSALAAPLLAGGYARWGEPEWLAIRRVRIAPGKPTHRIVQFSDVHHKGDRAHLESVVRRINALEPDLVCFTGDLVEKQHFLAEALEILRGIAAPLYGVPGNWDFRSRAVFDQIEKSFAANGGAWLMDRQVMSRDGKLNIVGLTCTRRPQFELKPDAKNLLLIHYPTWADEFDHARFDLILAGHSHGGQVRLPFVGALILPTGVGKYDRGLFQTAQGPLYVNPGIGYLLLKLRFNCRPELTVFEV